MADVRIPRPPSFEAHEEEKKTGYPPIAPHYGVEKVNHRSTLTCVYCGMAYPPGTPTHGTAVLTAHIKVCAKHPLRIAEERIGILEAALRKEDAAFRALLSRQEYFPAQAEEEALDAAMGALSVTNTQIADRIGRLTMVCDRLRALLKSVVENKRDLNQRLDECLSMIGEVQDLLPRVP